MHILDIHRKNYGVDGPKNLTVLWWEWPRIHWEELRNGASMNFMTDSPPGFVPNQSMDGSKLYTAVKFVDELIDIGVLRPKIPSKSIFNNFPLFLIEKLAQPGEYHAIR